MRRKRQNKRHNSAENLYKQISKLETRQKRAKEVGDVSHFMQKIAQNLW